MLAWLNEYASPANGQFCPAARFRRNFIRWVDRVHGPQWSLWFAQKRRCFRVLQDTGGLIGYWQPARTIAVGVANLSMPDSRQVCERKLVLESDAPGLAEHWLMPTDFK
jgi:hypothetical protein